MEAQNLGKSNIEIIADAKRSFKGQLGAFILAMLISMLALGVVIMAFAVVEMIILSVLALVFSGFLVGIFMLLLGTIFLAFILVIQGKLWVWQTNYVLETSKGNRPSLSSLKDIFTDFDSIEKLKALPQRKEELLKLLFPALTMIIMGVGIALGFVLLILPGILLSYMWSQVAFLVAENPERSPLNQLKLSAQMMDGHKMKLFWCYFRLMPLFFLCLLPIGLGMIWLGPFMSFLGAEFFKNVKEVNSPKI